MPALKAIASWRTNYGFRLQLRLGFRFWLGLAFFKYLCDNNACHKLAYSIGNKFDYVECNYKTCRWAIQ